jgi:hypothetical protein
MLGARGMIIYALRLMVADGLEQVCQCLTK